MNDTLFGRMGIDVGIIVLLLVILVAIMAVVTVSMSVRLSRLTRKYRLFMKGKDGQSMERAFTQKFNEIDGLVKLGEEHGFDITELKRQYGGSLHKYGMVKYDAFDDVRGKLSFAIAFLDTSNSGFILDAIHSRDNCFLYLKEIVNGESYIMLSEEEVEALRRAVSNADKEFM